MSIEWSFIDRVDMIGIRDASKPFVTPIGPESDEVAVRHAVWDAMRDLTDSDRDPLCELPYLALMAKQVEHTTMVTVCTARQRGATWEQIGQALGMTKQGAQQRYGSRTA